MNLRILLIPGDGIGTEVTAAAVDVLKAVAKKFGHTLDLSEGLDIVPHDRCPPVG